jgi:hypothetical protein
MYSIEQIKAFPQTAAGRKALIQALDKEPHILDLCFEEFFSTSLRTCQEISWTLTQIGGARPNMITPYIDRIIETLQNTKAHNAFVRNSIRIWQEMDIPEDYRGLIFDICYEYILDNGRQIAVRAFSMNVCVNICLQHPELKEDLLHALDLLESVEQDNFYFPHRCAVARKAINV